MMFRLWRNDAFDNVKKRRTMEMKKITKAVIPAAATAAVAILAIKSYV